MAPSFDPNGVDADLAIDVFAAQLRLEHKDAAQQAEALAQRLASLLPHLTTLSYQSKWPLGKKTLKKLRLVLGNQHYELLLEGPQVQYRRVSHVGGIDLAHHDLTQQEWLSEVKEGMAAQFAKSAETTSFSL